MRFVRQVSCVGCLCTVAGIANAGTVLHFNDITSNNVADAAIAESQLFVDVSGAGPNQALFTFFNVGLDASSITDVYFDDGSLLALADLIDADQNSGDLGVNFSQLASPPNLPGGNTLTPAFQTTEGFLADSNPPVQPNGVNPGESLGVLFDLKAGQTVVDVLNELDTGALRIGIHVQGFASGGSESLVNAPGPVPLPASAGLAGAGLLAILARRRR